MRWELASAEEGTPEVDGYLAAFWQPFTVVSTPVTEWEVERIGGVPTRTGREIVVGHVNVIWFRREVAS